MYTVGKKYKEKYPIYNEEGRIIAECLNAEDADDIVKALSISVAIKEIFVSQFNNKVKEGVNNEV